MNTVVLFICFIIILFITSFIACNLDHYNYLIKDTWADAPILLNILLALCLSYLTLAVFIKDYTNNMTIPIYLLIIIFEIIMLITVGLHMHSISILVASLVFIMTCLEMVFFIKRNEKKLCWLVTPFLFFSLLQIAITDNLYSNNVDYTELIDRLKQNF